MNTGTEEQESGDRSRETPRQKSEVRSQKFRSQETGDRRKEVRSQKSEVRSQKFRSQESGDRRQESGVGRQESGDRRQESGVGSRESGDRRWGDGKMRESGKNCCYLWHDWKIAVKTVPYFTYPRQLYNVKDN